MPSEQESREFKAKAAPNVTKAKAVASNNTAVAQNPPAQPIKKLGEDNMSRQAYEQGFIDKCAEMGVDPVQLTKTANWLMELLGKLKPIGESALRGAKAFGHGVGTGALSDLPGAFSGAPLAEIPAGLAEGSKSRMAHIAGRVAGGALLPAGGLMGIGALGRGLFGGKPQEQLPQE